MLIVRSSLFFHCGIIDTEDAAYIILGIEMEVV
jgi:hypothetical protein